jgi:sugar fermentation stimulation protein A
MALVPHRWSGRPLRARLLERENRFLARCDLDGEVVHAHVADRGRCLDLLLPGQPLVLVEVPSAQRRTRYTALLARARTAPSPWVSLDPAGAPRLVAEALRRGLLPSLAGLAVVAREVALGRSRLDLLLGPAGRPPPARGPRLSDDPALWLCEVKSVGAARQGVALFPDAPTERGVRHLGLLAARARRGLPTAVVFVAQRADAVAVAPDRETDPAFAAALLRAAGAGVRLCGLACAALPEGMELLGEVPLLS